MYKKVSKQIYEHSYKFILLFWTIFVVIAFLFKSYPECIEPYELIYRNLGITSLALFSILSSSIVIHIVKYRNSDRAMVDLRDTEKGAILGGGEIKYKVIPIYALMLFSTSKVIITIKNYSIGSTHALALWGLLLIASSISWFLVKNKAERKFDFKLTIFVSIYTIVIIFWEIIFMPFTKSVLVVGQCVGKQIIELKINDNNESIYDYEKHYKVFKETF